MNSEFENPNLAIGREKRERYRFKPCVVVVSGLPATGKSTFGRFLEKTSNFEFLDVDVIREEIDDIRRADPTIRWLSPDQELEIMLNSYTLMCQRAEELAEAGTPVAIAGTFSRGQFKEPLQVLKDSLDRDGIPLRVLRFTAPDEALEGRITRQKGKRGVSNVDSLDTFRWARSIFSPIESPEVGEIDTKSPGHYLRILDYLSDLRSSPL